MTSPFVATHQVPPAGLDTRADPDPDAAPNSRLDPALEVAVVQELGVWAEVRCSNGWTAWVDGRLLVPLGPAAPPTPGSPDYYVRLHEQAFAARAGAAQVGGTPAQVALAATAAPAPSALKLTPVLIGCVVAAGAGFLPWFGSGTATLTGFQIPIQFLVDKQTQSTGGPTVGLFVIGLAVAATVCSLSPQFDPLRRVAGGLIVLLPTMCVAQVQSAISAGAAEAPGVERPSLLSVLGIGLAVAVVGGLAIALPPKRDDVA